MTYAEYERECKKYQDSIGVKIQYNICINFCHHPAHFNSDRLILESTTDKKEAKELVLIYRKLIKKKGDKYFLDNAGYKEDIEVANKNVYVAEEYILEPI